MYLRIIADVIDLFVAERAIEKLGLAGDLLFQACPELHLHRLRGFEHILHLCRESRLHVLLHPRLGLVRVACLAILHVIRYLSHDLLQLQVILAISSNDLIKLTTDL
jgi:hypothetical protein